jgi:FAD/FMN-containing dehydrogenase
MSAATLGSWGRYPPHPQIPHGVHWRDEIPRRLRDVAASAGSTLAYGNGRSYGDSCMASSDQVLHTRALSRFIEADWDTGRLVVEAGMTLDEVLAQSIPRGWFLPVTPGTRFATVGGAIANDVHGKNHHVRGTFGRHVGRLHLVRSDQAPVTCSPETEGALFRATIGGLGLTGVIAWAELSLLPLRSGSLDVTTVRFDSLDEFFALSAEFDSRHEYTVAWVDCLARGAARGRGVFSAADHAASGALAVADGTRRRIPVTPPVSAVNRATIRLFNAAYFHRHKAGKQQAQVNYAPFFYPLDGMLEWNRVYGPRGFQQYQCVVPDAQARDAVSELLGEVAAAGTGSMLAVLKKCGNLPSPGLVSFPLPGVSLALDFPQSPLLGAELFPRLDRIVRSAGGRLYPAKDAHMSGADFRAAYPGWQALESLRDPVLCSRFWQRVTTT